MIGAGMLFVGIAYRYGFNGKEKDTQGEWGNQTHYDYGFRIYNPGIGRWLGIDPRQEKYPSFSPYSFSSNNPILNIDSQGDTVYVFSQLDVNGNALHIRKELLAVISSAKLIEKVNGIQTPYAISTHDKIVSGDLKLDRSLDLVVRVGNVPQTDANPAITWKERKDLGAGYIDMSISHSRGTGTASYEDPTQVNAGRVLSHETITHGNGRLVSRLLGYGAKNTGEHIDYKDEMNMSSGRAFARYQAKVFKIKDLKIDSFKYPASKIKIANLLNKYQKLSTSSSSGGHIGHGNGSGVSATKKKLKQAYDEDKQD